LPKIDTLVRDIYGLFDGDVKFDVELFKQFGINTGQLMDDRFHQKRDDNPRLRMSNIGKPDRQLWYDLNFKGEREQLLPHTLIKFAYGDLIEQMIILYAKMAGHDVQLEQGEVEVDGIKGHIDCIIDGCVVDVKSASSYSFAKFASGQLLEPGNDPFGYVKQLAGYVEALTPGKPGYFLAVDKTLGKITLLEVSPQKLAGVHERIDHIKAVVAAPEPPERCYEDKPDGASGNRMLDTGCSYCNHKHHCWADANGGVGIRTFLYGNGPRFLTKVVRLPNVPEGNAFG
jgi:hypothetical protein